MFTGWLSMQMQTHSWPPTMGWRPSMQLLRPVGSTSHTGWSDQQNVQYPAELVMELHQCILLLRKVYYIVAISSKSLNKHHQLCLGARLLHTHHSLLLQAMLLFWSGCYITRWQQVLSRMTLGRHLSTMQLSRVNWSVSMSSTTTLSISTSRTVMDSHPCKH